MNKEILNQGLDLMVFGMGTVFVFLTLLVIVTSIMSAIIGRYFPDSHHKDQKMLRALLKQQTGDQQVVSAIMAAIKLHRSRHKK